MNRRLAQSGYVLILTLVLLALLAIATMRMCRISLQSVVLAQRAEQDLQHRWGAISCRTTFLEGAPQRMERRWNEYLEERNAEMANAEIAVDADYSRFAREEGTFRLGDMHFHVIIADEQAKLNVNTLHRRLGPITTTQILSTITTTNNSRSVVDLQPLSRDMIRTLTCEPFPDFSRVLREPSFESLIPPATDAPLLERMTCWGNGQLRWHFADEQSLYSLCAPSPGIGADRVERLLEIRKKFPRVTAADLAQSLAITPRQQAQLKAMLTDRSECYSMRLTTTSQKRSWTEMSIYRPSARAGEPLTIITR